MPEINDFLVGGLKPDGTPQEPRQGMPVCEPVRGHEVVDEVWEEKTDKAINIIPCTSISFAQGESLELQPGQTKKLEVVQDPFLSNIPYLTFESSDLKVAQIIDDCVVYGCCEGEATITASSSDGSSLVATINVTVAPKKAEEGGGEEPDPEEGKGEFIKPTLPEHVYVGEEYEVSVGFKSDTDILGVKFVATTVGPGDVTYTLSDGQGNDFSFVNNIEWGGSGFDVIAPYEQYTPVKAVFSAVGTFEFTTRLVKAATGEVINEDIATITVEDKSAEGEDEEVVTTQATGKSKRK